MEIGTSQFERERESCGVDSVKKQESDFFFFINFYQQESEAALAFCMYEAILLWDILRREKN